ncbi:hypothetical protein MNBD_GAMMA11-1924 [hydrothermal vent metagenome]|uniref:SPOR domain-containing protein n=1 Tax=hydrothermal vent metagenome TaxID=652676 RepID=A0A3B0XUN4_9ZZZZ
MARKAALPISTHTRLIIGGIGGIAPIIISLLVVDIRSLINELQMMDAIGLAVRCSVLVFIGALVGYLHQDESEPFKVFQLGIAAPALLTTAINGYGIAGAGGSAFKEIRTTYNEPNWSFQLISNAHAVTTKTDKIRYLNSSAFQEPKASNIERFLRGLIGKKINSRDDDWFVIAGSHTNANKAKRQVSRLSNKKYRAKIYQPTSGSRHFAVAIGANLSMKEAQALREKAIKNGLPKDTYLWRH